MVELKDYKSKVFKNTFKLSKRKTVRCEKASYLTVFLNNCHGLSLV